MKQRDKKMCAVDFIKQEDCKLDCVSLKTSSHPTTTIIHEPSISNPTIKQEDCKLDLVLPKTHSTTIHEPSISRRIIKQEDTKEDKQLLQYNKAFEEKGYYYQCDLCTERQANLESVLQHRNSIHNIKLINHRKLKDINMEPDVHDPTFYCKSCKSSHQNAQRYKRHLKSAHFIILVVRPLHQCATPKNDTMVPDPNDPHLYCKTCDRSYKNEDYYKKHCQFVHGRMTFAKLNRQRSVPDTIMATTYCRSCNRTYASNHSYRRHLFVVHKVDWRKIGQKPTSVNPDPNDPNFYCNACVKTLSGKNNYHKHLMLVHAIYPSAPHKKKINLHPHVNDPNNHCRACQKTFPSKGRYRLHLRLVHQIAMPLLRGHKNRSKGVPDPRDPNLYCNVCQKSFATQRSYRMHCTLVHFMILDKFCIKNPNATIDINHPEQYCAQCEHAYSKKSSFRHHLIKVHNM